MLSRRSVKRLQSEESIHERQLQELISRGPNVHQAIPVQFPLMLAPVAIQHQQAQDAAHLQADILSEVRQILGEGRLQQDELIGRVIGLENEVRALRRENKSLHDRTLEFLREFKDFAAKRFADLQRDIAGLNAVAAELHMGCWNRRESVMSNTKRCLFLLAVLFFSVVKVAVKFYMFIRKLFLEFVARLFGPAYTVIWHFLNISLLLLESACLWLFVNHVGVFFGMGRIGTVFLKSMTSLLKWAFYAFGRLMKNLFEPVIMMFHEVWGIDIRHWFGWWYSICESVVYALESLASWIPVTTPAAAAAQKTAGDAILQAAIEKGHAAAAAAAAETAAAAAETAATAVLQENVQEVLEAARLAEVARLANAAREASAAAAEEAIASVSDDYTLMGAWRKLQLQALNWGLENDVLQVVGQKGGDPNAKFRDLMKGYTECNRLNQKFGYILTMLSLINQPSFHNPAVDEYFSNPQVQQYAQMVMNQTNVLYRIFKGEPSPSLLSKHIVPGVGLAKYTRKPKRLRKKKTKGKK